LRASTTPSSIGYWAPGLGSPVTPSAIHAHSEHLRAAGVSRFILQLLPHADTTELSAALTASGLGRLRGWAKHLGRVEEARPAETDLSVREIGRDQSETWARICAQGFGVPLELAPWLAATVGRNGWRHALAFAGDEPAWYAALFVDGPYAFLNFTATVEQRDPSRSNLDRLGMPVQYVRANWGPPP